MQDQSTDQTLLIVMDGVGIEEQREGNAFKQAETPNLDQLFENHFAKLKASGPAVGLPQGYTGNSEVGHLHLGAGRTIPQRLKRINQAIENQELREKTALKNTLEQAEENQEPVHLAGIISDGGIHGHIQHLKALLEISSEYDIPKVWIHAFTDGRDVEPKSAEKYLSQIQNWTKEYENAEIATIIGRYYAMDRDENWERTHKAYQAITQAEGYQFKQIQEPLEKTYEEGDYDYFIQPSASENYNGMKDSHHVIFYNFRADRERQIQDKLVKQKRDTDTREEPINPEFISMLPYQKEVETPSIFQKQIVENTLGEKIAENNLTQLRVAESQKKPHVTYFFNGQRELKFEGETREFIESDKIRSFDEKPEMHAKETTEIVLKDMEQKKHDFILLNYANPELVGHTGDLKATKKAIETVDKNIGKIIDKAHETGHSVIITSDHGNCDKLGNEEQPNTSHTLNPVPLTGYNLEKLGGDKITDIRKMIEKELNIS